MFMLGLKEKREEYEAHAEKEDGFETNHNLAVFWHRFWIRKRGQIVD